MHTFMHTYIHPCIHTYTHTYTHTYIHTYIHIFLFAPPQPRPTGQSAPHRAAEREKERTAQLPPHAEEAAPPEAPLTPGKPAAAAAKQAQEAGLPVTATETVAKPLAGQRAPHQAFAPNRGGSRA